MQKSLNVFLGLVLLLTLAACGTPPPPTQEDTLITQDFILEKIYNSGLDLKGLNLTQVPAFCEIMTKPMLEDVLFIDLSNNKIQAIANNFTCFPNLKEVNLSYNQIQKLENLSNIPLMRAIDVHQNNLKKIDLKGVPQLKTLLLGYNQLETRDLTDVWQLTSLEELELQHNQINSIADIAKLTALKKILVEYNQITEVVELDKLKNLEFVSVGENPLDRKVIQKWVEFTQSKK